MIAPFRPTITYPQTGVRWQQGQRYAVRDKIAYVRIGGIIIPIERHDVGHCDHSSVWVTPGGKQYRKLKYAVDAIYRTL